MNLKLKKFKILEPNVKIKTNVNIVTREIKEINFIAGNMIPLFNNYVDMITGTIEEE